MAAKRNSDAPSGVDKLPFPLFDGAAIEAEFHAAWPDDAGTLPAGLTLEPLVVHYVRARYDAKLADVNTHYGKHLGRPFVLTPTPVPPQDPFGLGGFPGAGVPQQPAAASDEPEERWFDQLEEIDGRWRSTDLLIQPQGPRQIVEILQIEIPALRR
jgi:hypothetical protein